jgi:NAD(P)-dependent dehydrogenase (short-subunit alcohol dehydrogenase family)
MASATLIFRKCPLGGISMAELLLYRIQADITNPKDVDALADELKNREPNGINILVNNAGISLEAEKKNQTSTLDFNNADAVRSWLIGEGRDIWHQTLSSNLISHHFVTATLLPLLSKGSQSTPGHSSSVLNISSISGTSKTPSGGQFAYSVSKAALTHLTKELAACLHPLRIRFNCIEPGIFPSEMTTGESDDKQKSKFGEGVGEKFPASMSLVNSCRISCYCRRYLRSYLKLMIKSQDVWVKKAILLVSSFI